MPKKTIYKKQMVLRMTDRQAIMVENISVGKKMPQVEVVRAMINYSIMNQVDFLKWFENIRGI